jgi:hypothetical protein
MTPVETVRPRLTFADLRADARRWSPVRVVRRRGGPLDVHELASDQYRLRQRATGGDIVTSPLLPALSFAVQEIFQDIA